MNLTRISLTKLWGGLIFIALALIFAAVSAPIDNESGAGVFRFLGRFHVLVLHFPVVLLFLAPCIELLSIKKQFHSLVVLVPFFWLIGAISAIITVSLGLMLASNEGFQADQVRSHQLGGVSVALLSLFVFGIRVTCIQLNKRWTRGFYYVSSSSLVILIMFAAHAGGNLVHGDTYLTQYTPEPVKTILNLHEKPIVIAEVDDAVFNQEVTPVIDKYCLSCHGPDKQKGNVRFDTLNPDMINGHDAEKWHAALDMINSGEMPPAKEEQPNNEERRAFVTWMTDNIKLASAAHKDNSTHPIRRLTKQQYTNTLQELLGVDVDFGSILPDDGKSELGFSNDGEVLQMTSLHGEYFQKIAKDALLKAVNLGDKPEVFHFKVTFGKNAGKGNIASEIGGFKEVSLEKNNFSVEILDEQGNVRVAKTTEEQAKLDKIKKNFSVSLRGSSHDRFVINKDGIVLASALPHVEKPPYSFMGPSPNLKIQVKDLFPNEGTFKMRVTAEKGNLETNVFGQLKIIENAKPSAKYNVSNATVNHTPHNIILNGSMITKARNFKKIDNFWRQENLKIKKSSAQFVFKVKEEGFYQIDIIHPKLTNDNKNKVKLNVDRQELKTSLDETGKNSHVSALASVYLSKGKHRVAISAANFIGFSHIVLTQAENNTKLLAARVASNVENKSKFDDKQPSIQPFIGTRLDDGMDYQQFSDPLNIEGASSDQQVYTFTGRLDNLPVPASANPEEPLAGITILGLWNNFLVKENKLAGPPLLVKSIEVEAPYLEQWPTKTHQAIFFDSSNKDKTNKAAYSEEVIAHFGQKAFRRPLSPDELTFYLNYWQAIKGNFKQYEESMVEVMVAMLTSPKFLYLPEEPIDNESSGEKFYTNLMRLVGINAANASTHQGKSISEFALASRLSYFLWNSAPDQTLLTLAAKGELSNQLNDQVDRMLEDPKVWQFIRPFTYEWLRVDRHESMNVNVDLYPNFTRFVKADMSEESYQFIHHVIKEDKSIFTLVDSDFAMLNQNLAEYYGINSESNNGIDDVIGNEFRAVSVTPEQHRGGLLSQGAFLAGHSNGEQAHPVKRAIWFKEKILGTQPPPPPPNVPALDPDTPGFENLTLKQQLETHRNKESCRDCHAMIDPYGVAFENFDAAGLYQTMMKGRAIDAVSILPDGSEVNGVDDIKRYVIDKKSKLFTLSLIKHLYSYSLGREVKFSDEATLQTLAEQVEEQNYGMRSVIKGIVNHPTFKQL